MGREVKRVPADFDWPIDKVWDGFLTPERLQERPCPTCCDSRGSFGTGYTPAAKWLQAALYLIGMMADDLRAQSFEGTEHEFTQYGDSRAKLHPYLATLQQINVYEHRRPSADIADLVTGITGRGLFSMGTGSDFAYKATDVLKEAAGVGKNWGICPTCDGHGSVEKYEGQRSEAEAWEPTDIPTGDGWQVWETVSEGSPISPVFPSKEGLIGWLMSPAYTWGTSRPLTREQADAFIESAWAPSGVVINGRVLPGDAAIAELDAR